MALTIREIMEKHTSVKQLPLMKQPIYDAGLAELGIQSKSLDLVDLHFYRETNQKRIEELEEKVEQQKKLADQIEYDLRVSKEVNERIEKEKAAEKERSGN